MMTTDSCRHLLGSFPVVVAQCVCSTLIVVLVVVKKIYLINLQKLTWINRLTLRIFCGSYGTKKMAEFDLWQLLIFSNPKQIVDFLLSCIVTKT